MSPLSSEQARIKLDPDKESWLSLGCCDCMFRSYAIRNLLYGVEYAPPIASDLLHSAMNRGDKETCRIYINDWGQRRRHREKPVGKVGKFIPGDHFHVLGRKFDSLDEAVEHLEAEGYQYVGLEETFVYPEEGG